MLSWPYISFNSCANAPRFGPSARPDWVVSRNVRALPVEGDDAILLLCSAAGVALVVCVAADGVLTSLRLIGAQWSIASLVPLISVAIEIACAAVLVSSLRAMARRAAGTARLVPAA